MSFLLSCMFIVLLFGDIKFRHIASILHAMCFTADDANLLYPHNNVRELIRTMNAELSYLNE